MEVLSKVIFKTASFLPYDFNFSSKGDCAPLTVYLVQLILPLFYGLGILDSDSIGTDTRLLINWKDYKLLGTRSKWAHN
jgi:hypothetical protein